MINYNGGPAFPVPSDTLIDAVGAQTCLSDYGREPQPGMSLLDWFAGQALNPLIAFGEALEDSELPDGTPLCVIVATQAYAIAEAMIEERRRIKEQNNAAE